MSADMEHLIIQGLWTLIMFFIAFLMKGIREDIRETFKAQIQLAKDMGKLELKMVAEFVTKAEAEPRWKKLHDVGNSVLAIETQHRLESGHD